MLYRMEMTGELIQSIMRDLEEEIRSVPDAEAVYAKKVIKGVYEKKNELDEMINRCLIRWRPERVNLIERCILRLAAYEIKYMPDISPAVAINEAVELAKRYGDEKSPIFVNGVLDAVRKELGCEEERK